MQSWLISQISSCSSLFSPCVSLLLVPARWRTLKVDTLPLLLLLWCHLIILSRLLLHIILSLLFHLTILSLLLHLTILHLLSLMEFSLLQLPMEPNLRHMASRTARPTTRLSRWTSASGTVRRFATPTNMKLVPMLLIRIATESWRHQKPGSVSMWPSSSAGFRRMSSTRLFRLSSLFKSVTLWQVI